MQQISRGKFDRLPRTTAGFTPVPLMDVGFAITSRSARHRRPQIQFLSSARVFAPRFFQTSPRGSPCASLTLHLHQVARGLSPQLSDMLGTE